MCHNIRFLHCTFTGFFQREPNLKRLSINSEHQDCVERDMVKSQHTGLLGSKAKNNHKSTNAQLDNKHKKTRHACSPKRAGKKYSTCYCGYRCVLVLEAVLFLVNNRLTRGNSKKNFYVPRKTTLSAGRR